MYGFDNDLQDYSWISQHTPFRFVSHSNSATQSNGYKLFKQSCYSNIRLHSFSQKVVNGWNSLPADLENTPDADGPICSKLFWTDFGLTSVSYSYSILASLIYLISVLRFYKTLSYLRASDNNRIIITFSQ